MNTACEHEHEHGARCWTPACKIRFPSDDIVVDHYGNNSSRAGEAPATSGPEYVRHQRRS